MGLVDDGLGLGDIKLAAVAGAWLGVVTVFAVVELSEGPHLTVNMVDTPAESLRCDMPVRIVFRDVGDDAAVPNARGDD